MKALFVALLLVGSGFASCPTGYADGCQGSPSGPIQYPKALESYGNNKPAWNVPGVNYYVGIPSGTALHDWRTLRLANVSVDTSTGFISCTTAGASIVLDAVDFTLGTGATLYSPNASCTWTVMNSLIGCGSAGGSSSGLVLTNDTTYKFNKFDGTHCLQRGVTTPSTFIRGSHAITIKYNWFLHGPQHVLETGGPANIDMRYNLIDDMVLQGGTTDQHENWQQLSGKSTIASDLVSFNFAYHHNAPTGQGEGFQWYCNSGPCTITAAEQSYNVVITVAGTHMSYAMHGSDYGSTTGTGINKFNYFDMAVGGPFYPNTFTASTNWTSICNLNMSTGKLIDAVDNTPAQPSRKQRQPGDRSTDCGLESPISSQALQHLPHHSQHR